MIIQGDCLEELKKLEENSIDAVVTDPPYGLSFMGKKWDYDVPSIEIWKECLRVLKPGGYLLSFAGTRTQHRMAVRIEDAGFEIRDMIMYVYGSGFPKSLNIFKQLSKRCTCGNMEAYDKGRNDRRTSSEQETEHDLRLVPEPNIPQAINSQEKQGEVLQQSLSEQSTQIQQLVPPENVWGEEPSMEGWGNSQEDSRELSGSNVPEMSEGVSSDGKEGRIRDATQISNGTTPKQTINENGSGTSCGPQSKQQQDREPCAFCQQYGTQAMGAFGYGSALKPACEPITVARKPISEKNLADNFLKWGVGGINIDGCRVGTEDKLETGRNGRNVTSWKQTSELKDEPREYQTQGRFPANLIHDGSVEVLSLFPNSKSTANIRHNKASDNTCMSGRNYERDGYGYDDSGSAARFFYVAKSSKRERNKGLDCYITVKYNNSCKEENTVAVQLLQRVISEQEHVNFSIDESGENIMVQCHKDSLSTILTELKRIIGLKIYNSLTLSLTNESTQDANSETDNGGSHVESVENLKRWILTTTNGNRELARGASRVVSEMLSLISEEENWKQATNFHSTVKPIALMEYLVKLVSREGALILDPFAGSGSTGIACQNLNRDFILIEREPAYVEIIKARLND